MFGGGRWKWSAACVALMSSLVATVAPPAGAVAGFGDVAPGRYYTSAVLWLVDEEITTGVGPGCFAPERTVTRAEAVVMMWRMVGSPAPSVDHPFTDIVKEWQADAVSWMYENGVTTGTSPSTFEPDRPLTRGEFAALLHRLDGSPSAAPTTYADVVRPWQLVPVGWLQARGITTGTAPDRFSPDLALTRGMLATFLWRSRGAPEVDVDAASPPCGGISQGLVHRWTDGIVAVDPVLSPSGRFIAYQDWFGFDFAGLPDVFVIDTLDGDATRITETRDDGEQAVTMFDDGSVAYGSFSDTAYIHDPVTMMSTELALPGFELPARTTTLIAVSTDRTGAVFFQDGATVLSHVDYDTSTVREIAIDGMVLGDALISADGDTVAFNVFEPYGPGSDAVETGFGVWDAATEEITWLSRYGVAIAGLSGDAETLLYSYTAIDATTSEYWVLDRTTDEEKLIGEGHAAQISGDGEVVAIVPGSSTAREGLEVVRVADGDVLYAGLAGVSIGTLLSMSDSGAVIAFDTDDPVDPLDANGQPDIHTIQVS